MAKVTKNKFQEKIVTFVDLLGFKNAILNAGNDSDKLEEITKKVISLQSHLAYTEESGYMAEAESFSDCVVRERGIFKGVFFSEILDIGFGLIEILNDGHIVRGALTHGLHYSDYTEKILVSPAFLRAYDLETKTSIYPRVIIDPRTLAHYSINIAWAGNAHSHAEDKKYVYSLLRQDKNDGLYFIDYLKIAWSNSDQSVPYFTSLLNKQKTIIMEGLQNPDGRVRSKYQWLGKYQNETIGEYPDVAGDFKKGWKQKYLIDTRLL